MSNVTRANMCERCGGYTYYETEKIYLRLQDVVVPIMCTCPPIKEKHNGKLDEKADCTVDYSPKSKSGTYVRIFMHDDGAILTPAQALSLLDWLRQEEETLKQLAEEQEAYKE